MRDFIIQHVSGDYLAPNHFTAFAAFAERFTEEAANRMVRSNARLRKLRVEPFGQYSPLPPTDLLVRRTAA